jgi:hypothetical protein
MEENPMPVSRSIRVLFILLLAAGGLLFGSVQPGLADPNLDSDPIPPHRHFVQSPLGELVEVGPRVCDDPALQHAFNQFHSNVHHALSPISPPGTQPGPGSENGAPGLHNGFGADLTFRSC